MVHDVSSYLLILCERNLSTLSEGRMYVKQPALCSQDGGEPGPTTSKSEARPKKKNNTDYDKSTLLLFKSSTTFTPCPPPHLLFFSFPSQDDTTDHLYPWKKRRALWIEY